MFIYLSWRSGMANVFLHCNLDMPAGDEDERRYALMRMKGLGCERIRRFVDGSPDRLFYRVRLNHHIKIFRIQEDGENIAA
jgi:hypothetical protein